MINFYLLIHVMRHFFCRSHSDAYGKSYIDAKEK